MKRLIQLAVLLMVITVSGTSSATEIAVVDTEKLLSQSEPGKQGQAHLGAVQKVLQKGYDDLRALYRGQEDTAEAREAVAQGRAALERQMEVERAAVTSVLQSELTAAVEAWHKRNPKFHAVIARQLLLGVNAKLDATSAVMKEMNKRKPKFAALPTVTVNKPEVPAKAEQAPAEAK
ncbi:MAG: hypothetical protein SOY64_07440 [Pyramidobacter sp.]|uniref:OmpH family outer membrane protein n=1 Tax=Pyramidobacter sp. TaxID=1943581 RepID=UPI002A80CE33|nr:hypothetical protein [Pyramidobacter sp.]MDY4032871.1 hypothetical protein [Pyramidobacter sp.]